MLNEKWKKREDNLDSHRYTCILFGYITSQSQPMAFIILSQDQPSNMLIISHAVL